MAKLGKKKMSIVKGRVVNVKFQRDLENARSIKVNI